MLQLISEGSSKLASVPSGGGGGGAAAPSGGAAAAGGAAEEEKPAEKEEEKEVRIDISSALELLDADILLYDRSLMRTWASVCLIKLLMSRKISVISKIQMQSSRFYLVRQWSVKYKSVVLREHDQSSSIHIDSHISGLLLEPLFVEFVAIHQRHQHTKLLKWSCWQSTISVSLCQFLRFVVNYH